MKIERGRYDRSLRQHRVDLPSMVCLVVEQVPGRGRRKLRVLLSLAVDVTDRAGQKLLAGGPEAVLSHSSAAFLWGLSKRLVLPLELTVIHGPSFAEQPSLICLIGLDFGSTH